MDKAQVVEYVSGADELDAFVAHYLQSTEVGRGDIRRGRLYTAAGVLVGTPFTAVGPLLVRLPLAVGLALGAFLIYPRFHRRIAIGSTRRSQGTGRKDGVLGWHRLSLLDLGLGEESEAGNQTTRYDSIFKVDETETHAFIYTTAAQAYTVPKRAVSVGDLQSFLETLRRRVDAA